MKVRYHIRIQFYSRSNKYLVSLFFSFRLICSHSNEFLHFKRHQIRCYTLKTTRRQRKNDKKQHSYNGKVSSVKKGHITVSTQQFKSFVGFTTQRQHTLICALSQFYKWRYTEFVPKGHVEKWHPRNRIIYEVYSTKNKTTNTHSVSHTHIEVITNDGKIDEKLVQLTWYDTCLFHGMMKLTRASKYRFLFFFLFSFFLFYWYRCRDLITSASRK